MNLMVYLCSDYHLMGTGILIFRQVEATIVVAENDTPIRLQIEPCNLSTTTPLVINRDTYPVDLTKKANPCLRNEEHKQEQERKQPNCRLMINLTKLGSHKPMNDETVLDRII